MLAALITALATQMNLLERKCTTLQHKKNFSGHSIAQTGLIIKLKNRPKLLSFNAIKRATRSYFRIWISTLSLNLFSSSPSETVLCTCFLHL